MKSQETKFTLVYSKTKQCILEGQIPPGSALPSSRMYYEQLRMSRYTINHVFDALQAEGSAGIQLRLTPVVVSRKDSCNSSNTVSEILKQRESILQLHQTFAFTLPSLVVLPLRGYNVEIVPHYKQAMKTLCLGDASGEWSSPSKLGYDILRIGGGPLFSELYSVFGSYNKPTLFAEDYSYFPKHFLRESVSATSTVIDTLKGDESFTKYNQSSDMYQKLTDSVERTLDYLSETMLKRPTRTSLRFSWSPIRGQDYYYSKTVDNMDLEIGPGEYSIRVYLPYEKQLTNQYDIPLSTVKKALSELEQREFVKRPNDKGTIVIEPDDTGLHQLVLNSGYVGETLRYLHALQLMALIIRPAALAAAARLIREELDELTDRFTSLGSAYLANI